MNYFMNKNSIQNLASIYFILILFQILESFLYPDYLTLFWDITIVEKIQNFENEIFLFNTYSDFILGILISVLSFLLLIHLISIILLFRMKKLGKNLFLLSTALFILSEIIPSTFNIYLYTPLNSTLSLLGFMVYGALIYVIIFSDKAKLLS